MAKLKSGSVVAGDLTVEGKIIASIFENTEGANYTTSLGHTGSRLAKFANDHSTDSLLVNSLISDDGSAISFLASATLTGTLTLTSHLYLPGNIYHSGDTDTYTGFHEADQWRVVTGGTERFEVTNSAITAAVRVNANAGLGLDDNDILYLGSGDDVRVFYNGTHLYTDFNDSEVTTNGNWYIRDDGTNRFIFDIDTGNLTATTFTGNLANTLTFTPTSNRTDVASKTYNNGSAQTVYIYEPNQDLQTTSSPTFSTITASTKVVSSRFYMNAGSSGNFDHIWFDDTNNTYHFVADRSDGATGNATLKADTFSGNASTASAWATGRTITLTGAVTGTSAAWTGSGNISITTTATADPTLTLTGDASGSATFTNLGDASLTVTVANNSHTHTSANISDATNANTGNMIVKRDGSGNFSAGTITAESLESGTFSLPTANGSSGQYLSHNGTWKTPPNTTYLAGTGISLSGTIFSHADTSNQSSSNNSGNTFIQDITLDGFGHVTGLGTNTINIGDGRIDIVAGSGLSGNGTFKVNQSSDEVINISHADTSSQGSVNNSGSTVIQDITLDTYGHVTGISSYNLDNIYTRTSELTGTILPFAGSTAPSGSLMCHGQEVSRTTYSRLYSVIGTTWGSGNGSSTFNVPDLRGAFLRGTGTNVRSNIKQSNGSAYSGPALGSPQQDEMFRHRHNTFRYSNGGGASAGISGDYSRRGDQFVNEQVGGSIISDPTRSSTTYGNPRSGYENRPFNYGVNYIIIT